MSTDAIKALEDDIYAFVGKEIYPLEPAPDNVNEAMIRHWSDAIGDKNPAYSDKEWAASSARGHVIAPPAMMYVWGQEGFAVFAVLFDDSFALGFEVFADFAFEGEDEFGGLFVADAVVFAVDAVTDAVEEAVEVEVEALGIEVCGNLSADDVAGFLEVVIHYSP